jgi:hypothetical protein
MNGFTITRGHEAVLEATVHGDSLIVIAPAEGTKTLAKNWWTRLRAALIAAFEAEQTPYVLSPATNTELVYVDISGCKNHPRAEYFLREAELWINDAALRTVYGKSTPRLLASA